MVGNAFPFPCTLERLPGFKLGSENFQDLPASYALTLLYAALDLVVLYTVVIKMLKYIAVRCQSGWYPHHSH